MEMEKLRVCWKRHSTHIPQAWTTLNQFCPFHWNPNHLPTNAAIQGGIITICPAGNRNSVNEIPGKLNIAYEKLMALSM